MEGATASRETVLGMQSDYEHVWQKRSQWKEISSGCVQPGVGMGEAKVLESALGKYFTFLAFQTNLNFHMF